MIWLILSWSFGLTAHAEFNHHLNKDCVRTAELFRSSTYIDHDVKLAQSYIEAQGLDTLEVVIVHPGDPIHYDYHTNRIRIFVNAENQITSARCG